MEKNNLNQFIEAILIEASQGEFDSYSDMSIETMISLLKDDYYSALFNPLELDLNMPYTEIGTYLDILHNSGLLEVMNSKLGLILDEYKILDLLNKGEN